ncbi:MAG: hypothetical protein AMS25_02405 [Gemmatimonas sp. SM23_52]|nr:MAG: hypothetical protein AMS25_02405 [Gemmatimonas sp. SM23_52]
MAKIVSIHEYHLKPGVETEQFEQALREASQRGLFELPGLVKHRFLKGIRGSRRGEYAALWVYESRAAWERLWGPVYRPRPKHDYPDNWRIWEDEVLAAFLDRDPDRIRFTAYEEL